MRKKLSARAVEAIKPPEKGRTEVTDTESGAVFRVTAKGARSWSVLYTLHGRQQRLTLGTHPAVGLAEARDAARRARHLASQGIDPAADKKREKARERTYADAAEEYLVAYAAGRLEGQRRAPTPRSVECEQMDARRTSAVLGERPVAQIGKADIVKLMDGVAHLAPTSRRRAWGVASRILNRELARDHIEANPFAGRTAPAASEARDRYLTRDEVVAVWDACEHRGTYGGLVRLLIALPLRRSLASGLRWGQVDLDARTVTFSAADTGNKSREETVLPLNDVAVEVLRTLPQSGDAGSLVFPGQGGGELAGWSKMKAALDRESGVSDWVLHDLRRTTMRHLGDALPDLDVDAAERLLMHRRQGIAAVYQTSMRLAGMRRIADAWSRILSGWIGRETGVVVEIGVGEHAART